jgi:hypothetical protein
MKILEIVAAAFAILLVSLMINGCGGKTDYQFDGSKNCFSGEDLIISNVTPTQISLNSTGTTTIAEMDAIITNTNCEPVHFTATSAGFTFVTEDAFTFGTILTIEGKNIPIPSSAITGTSGFVDIFASTPTRTSINTVHIPWTK